MCVFSILVLFVGNVDVWHGNNDILVKHTAITMGRRAEVPEPEDKSGDEEIYPLPAQKRFTPDDSSQNYYEVEVKKTVIYTDTFSICKYADNKPDTN